MMEMGLSRGSRVKAYEDSDRLVHCRLVLLDDAGDRVDLGELLVKNGFASRKVLDWGRRIPQ